MRKRVLVKFMAVNPLLLRLHPELRLSDAVEEAMNTNTDDGRLLQNRWRLRCREDPDEPDDQLLFRQYRQGDGYVFGALTSYTRNRMASMIDEDDDGAEPPITVATAPDGSQFTNGTSYLLAAGNNIVFTSDRRVSTSDVERYLTWLIAQRAQPMPELEPLKFIDRVDRAALPARRGAIRSIKLGAALVRPGETTRAPAEGRRRVLPRIEDRQTVRRLLATVFGGNESFVDRIDERLREGEAVALDITLKVIKPKRDVGAETLEEILTALSDVPDDVLLIDTSEGEITAGQLRIRVPKMVEESEGVLDTEAVFNALIEVYNDYTAGGRLPR